MENKRTTKPKQEKSKGGRPSLYTEAIVEEICERLSEGEPLAQICRDANMPGVQTVYDWMSSKPGVSVAIARAREIGEDVIALDCLFIADDNGKDTRILEDGREVTDADVVQRAKLRIDTRLKLLAKWNPKKWGEKLDLNHKGDPDAPIKITREIIHRK